MADVRITTEVDTSGAASGMANLQNQIESTGKSIAAKFAQFFAVGAITSQLNEVIVKMHDIHHESERFGIDSDALQKIALAAKDSGVNMESVARAMNLATIAGSKAADGSKEFVAAFKQLNVNALEFNAAAPDQKILLVAEAFQKSTRNADDYAAVAKILGARFGTELIPAFEEIIKVLGTANAQLEIFSKQEIAAGESAYKLEQQLLRFVQVDFFAPVIKGLFYVKAAAEDAVVVVGSLLGYLARIAQLDFKGASGFGQNIIDVFKLQGPGFQGLQGAINPSAPSGGGSSALSGGFAGGGIGAGSTGGGGGGGAGSFDNYEARQEKLRLAALSDEKKLNDLMAQRAKLQSQLDEGMETRNLSNEEEVKLTDDILGLDEEIAPLSQRIADNKQAAADADARGVVSADQSLEKSRENTEILNLELQGRQAEADLLKITYDYQDKIRAALDKANEAREQGLELTAQENEALAKQLQEEEQSALNLQRQNQTAPASANPATGRAAPDASAFASMASAGLSFGQFDWVRDPAQRLRYEARAQLEALTGKNQFGTEERAMINANEAAWAKLQQEKTHNAANITLANQVSYWGSIAQGVSPINNPFAATYGLPNFATGQFTPLTQDQILALLTKQLEALNIIKTNLAPVPGQF